MSGTVRKGLAWSTLNTVVMRFGQVILSIVLARLLAPEQFGVYAVALTAQAVIMILADLGMGADLIRSEDHETKAPTVATLSILFAALLTALMVLSSGLVAASMGSPESAAPIAVLSVTILFSSIGVVPLAELLREFRQREMAVVMGADFIVSTAVTLGLVLLGWGAMGLAVGRVAGQCLSTSLQFWLTRRVPRFGFQRELAPAVLRFGVPLAGANILGWALLSIDKVLIAHAAGATVLGYYVMAFNVASLPSSVIAQAVRGVALPAFARVRRGTEGAVMVRTLTLLWAVGAMVSVLMAAMAAPLVVFLFGDKWAPAAPALAVLSLAGGLRILVELLNTFMIARGDSLSVLRNQAAWFVALMGALVVGTRVGGSVGAAWTHVLVTGALVLPLTLSSVAKSGVAVGPILRALWPPVLAAGPAFAVAAWISSLLPQEPLLALLAGGVVGAVVFALPLAKWFWRSLVWFRAADSGVPS